MAMAEVAGGEVIVFSLDEHSPAVGQHVRRGGRAVVLRQSPAGEMLTLISDGTETAILLATDIPATLNGRIRVNIANALAATAAAIAQEVPLETVRTALRGFSASFTQSPGRFNLVQVDGRQVVIDYFHNPHALEAVAEFVSRMEAPHTVAVIQLPGNRRDEDIATFGRLAGQTFDELVIRPALPEFQRPRPPGEVPSLLQAAAVAKGGKDSLIVLHADDAAAIWNYLTQRQHGEVTI
jgi:cyanophycin synthetase